MIKMIVIALLIFVTASSMTMVGKGGGNFYVLILTLGGLSIYEAAATGQFILFAASLAATLVFHKKQQVLWPLAFLVGGFASVFAFLGGYFSHLFSGWFLKILFAVMLIFAAGVMLIPVKKEKSLHRKKRGVWNLQVGNNVYAIHLGTVIFVSIFTGFASGLVGVAGGSFLVPVLVLAAGVTMQESVGTVSVLLMATSGMGVLGHALKGDFRADWAFPLMFLTVLGGILGGKLAMQSKPQHLKLIFAFSNILAAVLMFIHAFVA